MIDSRSATSCFPPSAAQTHTHQLLSSNVSKQIFSPRPFFPLREGLDKDEENLHKMEYPKIEWLRFAKHTARMGNSRMLRSGNIIRRNCVEEPDIKGDDIKMIV
jgi:hypothetical protein